MYVTLECSDKKEELVFCTTLHSENSTFCIQYVISVSVLFLMWRACDWCSHCGAFSKLNILSPLSAICMLVSTVILCSLIIFLLLNNIVLSTLHIQNLCLFCCIKCKEPCCQLIINVLKQHPHLLRVLPQRNRSCWIWNRWLGLHMDGHLQKLGTFTGKLRGTQKGKQEKLE